MKKILIVVVVLLILLLLIVKLTVPVVVDFLVEKQVNSRSSVLVSYDKVVFKLFTLDLIFKGLVIKEKGSTGKEVLSARDFVITSIDLFHGVSPEFVKLEFRDMSSQHISKSFNDILNVVAGVGDTASLGVDGGLSLRLNRDEEYLHIDSLCLYNVLVGDIRVGAGVKNFQYPQWRSGILDSLSFVYRGEQQLQTLLLPEIKKHGLKDREELSERLARSYGFTVATENLAEEYFGISKRRKDDKKRLKMKKDLLTLVKSGEGFALDFVRKENARGVSLGRVNGVLIPRITKEMNCTFTVL